MVNNHTTWQIKSHHNSKCLLLIQHIFNQLSFRELHNMEIHKLFLKVNFFCTYQIIQNRLTLYYYQNLITNFRVLNHDEQFIIYEYNQLYLLIIKRIYRPLFLVFTFFLLYNRIIHLFKPFPLQYIFFHHLHKFRIIMKYMDVLLFLIY